MGAIALPELWLPGKSHTTDKFRVNYRPWWLTRTRREVLEAIGVPTQKGTHAYTTVANTTTMNTDATCIIPASSLVITAIHTSNTTTDPLAPTNVTDGTNSATVADGSVWQTPIGRVSLFSWFDVAGRTATFTATFGQSNAVTMFVFTIPASATASWKDQLGTSTGATTTALGITTAGNCLMADELSIAIFCRGSSITAPTTFPIAGYTSLINVTNATRTVGMLGEYKVGVTAGSTETSGGTLAATANVARLIVTYKGILPASTVGINDRRISSRRRMSIRRG